MKKGLLAVALVVAVVAVAKRFGPNMQNMDWEKRLERMPDNAPPKWMFRNITAIRENTDQILELLDRDRLPRPGRSLATSEFSRLVTLLGVANGATGEESS